MYECFHCGCRSVFWVADYDYEDYGIEGKGIINTLTCASCGAYIEYYCDIKEDGEGVDLDDDN